MSEKLYEALEVCLNALEAGADTESVLKRFPEIKDELAPILEASQQAKKLAVSDIPKPVIHRGRARVLGHAAGMREAAARPRSRWSMFAFPRLATSLAIAFLFLISGTGLVNASTEALPGDNLYPVKRTWEDVRLLLAFDSEYREDLEDEFEVERLHEVDELLIEGRHETITFAGIVTGQDGDQWMVSGIAVQITPDSKLPDEPVTMGVSVVVKGRTNTDGFVEVEQVELLDLGFSLSPSAPVEVESSESDGHDNASEVEIDINADQDVMEMDSPYGDQSDELDHEDDNESHKSLSDDESTSDGKDDHHNHDSEEGDHTNNGGYKDNEGAEGGGDRNSNESH